KKAKPGVQSTIVTDLASQISASKALGYSYLYPNLIQPKCVGCHQPGNALGGIRYDTYDLMMNSGTIKPGDALGSTFCSALLNASLPPDAPALSNTEILQLCNWIQAGAKNDMGTVSNSPIPSSTATPPPNLAGLSFKQQVTIAESKIMSNMVQGPNQMK